jgi:hypothetical protein
VSFGISHKTLGDKATGSDGSFGCHVLVYDDRAGAEADLGGPVRLSHPAEKTTVPSGNRNAGMA